ncbi:MAG: hypothetical protein HZA93_13080 [Verrucomicrobia bacterium]|nr:hypothetical protein [Verrucomicrobiota bacterium]
MIILGEILSYGWWDSQHPREFFVELTEKASTLLLHNLLAGLEARIVKRLVSYYGEEYGRYLWETAVDEEDDDEIREVIYGPWLKNWSTLRAYVARRDLAEVSALVAGKAA